MLFASIGEGAEITKATLFAERKLFTAGFTMAYKEGMILIKKLLIMDEVLHKEILESGVAICRRSQAKARDDSPCIRIDDENSFLGRIEDYRVCSLLPDTVNR